MFQLLNENIPFEVSGSDSGFTRVRPIEASRSLRFLERMEKVRRGKMSLQNAWTLTCQEAQNTSDFPLLFADSLDRFLLAGYTETPNTIDAWAKGRLVSDFRPSKAFAMDGGEGINPEVAERAPYREEQIQESKTELTVKKRGSKFAFSLEAFINDDLGAIGDTPRRMGRKARRTEEYVVTQQIATDAAKAALFTTGNKNKVVTSNGAATDNPLFGTAGILDAWKVLSRMLDVDGQPIVIQGAVVVYPAELETVAMQIRSAIELRTTVGSDTIVSSNYLAGALTWVPNYRLAVDAETNPHTGWYMLANPQQGRPAIAYGRLRGREQPVMLMKSSNTVTVGGGLVSPMEGDFDSDAIEYKTRQFIGAAAVDPKMIVFSKGTGAA